MGTNPRKRKKTEKAKPTPPQKPRRDRGLRHVIINEERDKKSAKHQVGSLDGQVICNVHVLTVAVFPVFILLKSFGNTAIVNGFTGDFPSL